MQFTIWTKQVGDPDSAAWSEEYNKVVDDPQVWAEQTIKEFNASLHLGEQPRELLRVEVGPNDAELRHEWEKTNLVTIVVGRDNYDTYRCLLCGATGKRHGIGGNMILDRKRDHGACPGSPRPRRKHGRK